MKHCLIAADIGGTRLKLARFYRDRISVQQQEIIRVDSRLQSGEKSGFMRYFIHAIRQLAGEEIISGICISTAGIVDYAGTRIIGGRDYLTPLKDPLLCKTLSQEFGCPVSLINDADAALLGAAKLGYLVGSGIFGLLVVGTGCGFAICKNGRLWRPDRQLPLLGALETPAGSWDSLCSASTLVKEGGDTLPTIFRTPKHRKFLTAYLTRLAKLIENASLLYHTNTILIGGGLADGARDAEYDLAAALAPLLTPSTDFYRAPVVRVLAEGNTLPLLGGALLAAGEQDAAPFRYRDSFAALPTESAGENLHLEKCTAEEIVQLSLSHETAAATILDSQIPAIAKVAEKTATAFKSGGRLIYVGCGTSGRIAAMDAVELHCTYGLPKERCLTLISGGLAEAAISIEESFEEDASAVPEMILANISPQDVVLGISASGTAYYIRSALAFAKTRGAFTALISVAMPTDTAAFFDHHISLGTGAELVTGSTRMTAGTSTKKVINAISTAAMVLCGKVAGTYMIDFACINAKLLERAQGILVKLFKLKPEAAAALLIKHDYHLADAIAQVKVRGY